MRMFAAFCLALAFLIGSSGASVAADKPKASVEDQFKKMDKDGDGKISLQEFQGKRDGDKAAAAEKRFKALDKDNDGSLSLEEFKARGKKAK